MSPSSPRLFAAALALLLVAIPFFPVSPNANALPQSVQVGIVGSEPVINGGGLFHSSPAFNAFTFTLISSASISAATLAPYDTVVVNVASSDLGCSTAGLSATARTALVDFVAAGNKLIFYDSECTFGGSMDYTWLPYPFTTNNPGAAGGAGILAMAEENTLSCTNPSAHCFIDVNAVGSQTDAVGDSNVVVTQDANWCGDLKATNVNGITGFSHMYANAPNGGLYIYNGLDVDGLGSDPTGSDGSSHLAKIWLLELEQPWGPSNLPCSAPVICANSAPVISVSVDRPALGFDYFNDVPAAQSPPGPVSRVFGPLTIVASTSDPALTQDVTIYVDGILRGTFIAPPYSVVWDPFADPAPDGIHTILVRATESTPGHCPRVGTANVFVPPVSMGGVSRSLSFGNSVPVTNELQVTGARVTSSTTSTSEESTVIDHYVPQIDTLLEVMEDTATGIATPTTKSVHTTSTITRLSLMGGLIRAEALRSVADADLDRVALSGHATAGARFLDLTVNGVPLPLDLPPNTAISLPDGGYVVLNEQIIDTTNGRFLAVVNALHVYLDPQQARDEIILGQAIAGTDLLGRAIGGIQRDIDPQNDADLGGDAGDDAATATALAMPVTNAQGALSTHGRLDGSDPYDVYSIPVKHGQKIVVLLTPATALSETVDEVRVTPPTANVGATTASVTSIPDLALRLLEPGTLSERGASDLPLSAPERIELNVPVDGAWVIEIGGDYQVGNYTLDITVSDIALLPDDRVTGPDAPSTCVGAVDVGSAPVNGVIRDLDFSDFWSVHADIGDTLTAVLKPGEDIDGVDLDLYLYDGDCALLASSGLGKGLIPKGTPDAIPVLPVTKTDTYFLEVRRYNGVGNYVLDARATKPMPTLPNNDALAAGDAPNGCPGGALVVPNGGVYQGTFPDGDAGDAYSFPVPAGARVFVTVIPGAGNNFALQLLSPTCGQVGFSDQTLSVPEAIAYGPAAVPGTYTMVVTPVVGGGNYVFSVAVVGN